MVINKYLEKVAEHIATHEVKLQSFTDKSGGTHFLAAMKPHNSQTAYVIHVNPHGRMTHSSFPYERMNLKNSLSATRRGILGKVDDKDETL